MDKKLPKYMTIKEVAAFGHCSVRHIHDEKKRGILRCHKVGKRLLFSEDDVIKWFNRKTQVA